jgi:hypothetical protein
MRDIVIGLVLLFSVGARADKEARANAVFESRCAGCHLLGHGAPQSPHAGLVDVTLAWAKLGPERLRSWIVDPEAVDKATHCRVSGLVPLDVDLLLGLFKDRARPAPRPPVIPPEDAKAPVKTKSAAPTGQGRHR